jgi:predicted MPP superfamily phosphohydrolase
MSFLLRIIIALIIYFGVQFYFVKKTSLIIKRIFPHFTFNKLKYLKRIFIICLNIFPLAVILVWGYYLITNDRSLTPPEGILIDYLVIYPFWVFFTLVLQVVIFYLVSDIIKLVLLPIYKRKKIKWKIFEARVLFIILVVFAIYIPARVNYDLSNIDVRELNYNKADLNDDLANLKIVLISDIQVDRYTNGNRLKEFITKVNEEDADLILIAGDVITSTPKFINTAAENIGRLKAKHGVYACIGDHDNWAYRGDSQRSIREVTDALQKFDVPMIDNETRTINIGNAVIGITFLTNTYVERISEPLLDSLTNGNKEYDLKILLTHQPRNNLIKKASEYNYDMYLAGHTHGGQITLLFPFFNFSPTLIETNLVRGDFWFDKMLLVVTPGLGLSLAPIRYNSTPEVTVIKLSNKEYQ